MITMILLFVGIGLAYSSCNVSGDVRKPACPWASTCQNNTTCLPEQTAPSIAAPALSWALTTTQAAYHVLEMGPAPPTEQSIKLRRTKGRRTAESSQWLWTVQDVPKLFSKVPVSLTDDLCLYFDSLMICLKKLLNEDDESFQRSKVS